MRRCNRVTPCGDIIASESRGTYMGNRGVLHDAGGQIRQSWQVKRWITCLLEFRGRKRALMQPGNYTELFFLDEATALAAGHRPCAEFRHAHFLDFCDEWKLAHPNAGGSKRPTADEIDRRLHAERVEPGGTKRVFEADLGDLPDGLFVRRAEWGNNPIEP